MTLNQNWRGKLNAKENCRLKLLDKDVGPNFFVRLGRFNVSVIQQWSENWS